MNKKIATLAAAVALTLSGVAHAEPIIADVLHDYGGTTTPSSVVLGQSNNSNGEYIEIQNGSALNFSDWFDISSLIGSDIDHFSLTLTYSTTSVMPMWSFWLSSGGSSTMKQEFSTTDKHDIVTTTFDFTPADLTGFVNNGRLDFGVDYNPKSPNSQKLRLYDATLVAYGPQGTPPGNDVPEPATLALLGIGLLGAFGLRRKA